MTQNIDNFHTELIKASSILSKNIKQSEPGSDTYGKTEGILEIHGNRLYMRCPKSGCMSENNFYDFPSLP